MSLADLTFDERGLIPAIVQDAATGTVLMLAWMDREAIEATERTGEVHFHSRSRGALWRKGETSGNTLHAVEVLPDCDRDTLLVRAHPMGPVCHTGSATCWGADPAPPLARTLSELAALLAARKRELPEKSYSAELFRKGRGAIAQKVGEEALELGLAAVSESHERTVSELTDLLYSAMVLATELGIGADEVTRSLAEKKVIAQRRSG
ncbi:MAG: bifunctional phosphoribosyl-AMP cyclohydrolase/phosphoribosyl-ATP diphosphatase HisIE [Chloroflexi bacterium]|nr:MAG: bifunctional phosphoribosyl-AMP cyclohydrolase/phosphoribosyl-ATP diphosphatase HisIE [Chloroflexota bacterium]TMG41157.1 MAG: bifunctional phosphoribosyl-AMP cyclohydrolase/phosphoribosyl-ATP diphosphatase HisIE [Chloroflexota bacterium]